MQHGKSEDCKEQENCKICPIKGILHQESFELLMFMITDLIMKVAIQVDKAS